MRAIATDEGARCDIGAVTRLALSVLESLREPKAQEAAIEIDCSIEVRDCYPDMPDPGDADAHLSTSRFANLQTNATSRIVQ